MRFRLPLIFTCLFVAACGGAGSSQVGESCTRTADCLDGARCVALVCKVQSTESSQGRCKVDADCAGTIFGAFCMRPAVAGEKGFCRCRSDADCTTATTGTVPLAVCSTRITVELPGFCDTTK